MNRKLTPHFLPDPDLVDQIRKESTVSEEFFPGINYFYDVRWWPEGGCLALYEVTQNKQGWFVRKTYRSVDRRTDPHVWEPRQIDALDVEEIRGIQHEARKGFDSHWYEQEVIRHNAEVDAKAMAQAVDDVGIARKIAQEKNRRGMCWHGIRGDVDCPTCMEGKAMVEEQKRATRFVRASRPPRAQRRSF